MIQIDMFDVQLGASILLQFTNLRGKVIRVLADAGEPKSIQPPDRVHSRLDEILGRNDRVIDLLVGTHYDEDHLEGFVPIINDPSIEIRRAWLPPVANDVDAHGIDESIELHRLLPKQLESDSTGRLLLRYLNHKNSYCELFDPEQSPEPSNLLRELDLSINEGMERAKRIFLRFRDQALRYQEEYDDESPYSHANEEPDVPRDLDEWQRLIGSSAWFPPWYLDEVLADEEDFTYVKRVMIAAKEYTEGARSVARFNLASVKRSSASDAINAISLAKVVKALRRRQVPIECKIVRAGNPRRFVWNNELKQFVGGAKMRAQGPELTLLGPSDDLVRKHWNRLPIGRSASLALYSMIPLKYITPSNQLSYVIRFAAERQRVLISGDSGFVDFKNGRNGPYYSKLISALRRLNVVQVAHHAGNNAHFYRVLLEAGYGRQRRLSYLLLSHAKDDVFRPSERFGEFVEEFRQERSKVKMLFTNRPQRQKVQEYRSMIAPLVGPSLPSGDARLTFHRGGWHVEKHSIQVA